MIDLKVALGALGIFILWVGKLILTNEYADWAPRLGKQALRLAAVLQPEQWKALRREEWIAEMAYIAAEPGSSTGLSFAIRIATREILRTVFAWWWHPIEAVALVLVLTVEWQQPGGRWISAWVILSWLMIFADVAYGLFARVLREWSAPGVWIGKRLLWWVFTPDFDGTTIRRFVCWLAAIALAIQGIITSQLTPPVATAALIALALPLVRETRLGAWMSRMNHMQIDLRLRWAGNPPGTFPHRSG